LSSAEQVTALLQQMFGKGHSNHVESAGH
jgi:hypothetical protein